jgi:hypothetical protein
MPQAGNFSVLTTRSDLVTRSIQTSSCILLLRRPVQYRTLVVYCCFDDPFYTELWLYIAIVMPVLFTCRTLVVYCCFWCPVLHIFWLYIAVLVFHSIQKSGCILLFRCSVLYTFLFWCSSRYRTLCILLLWCPVLFRALVVYCCFDVPFHTELWLYIAVLMFHFIQNSGCMLLF